MEVMNWTSAEESCKQKGAHLTSIHSIEENEFLLKNLTTIEHVAPHVFIGGVRANAWNDGTYFRYANWRGQPRDPSCDYYTTCIAFDPIGYWIVNPCNEQFNYICKKSRQGNYMVYLSFRKIHDVKA